MGGDDCICQKHSGIEQHKIDIDKKMASACTSVTSAHKRIDAFEKEIVGMTTFRWTIGLMITVFIAVIAMNASVYGKINDKLDRVDKAVTIIEARMAPGKTGQ